MIKLWWMFFIIIFSGTVKSEVKFPEEKNLITNFDNLGLVKKNEWRKGSAPDGEPVKTFRNMSDIYSLSDGMASAVSITKGDNHKQEYQHSENVCRNLAYGVLGKKDRYIADAVSNIIMGAARMENRIYSEKIDDFSFQVQFTAFDERPTLLCRMSDVVFWD